MEQHQSKLRKNSFYKKSIRTALNTKTNSILPVCRYIQKAEGPNSFFGICMPNILKEDLMAKAVVDKERCKGCGCCVRVCSQKALSFSEKINSQGVNYIQVDEAKCIGCGMCYTMCPDLVFEIR